MQLEELRANRKLGEDDPGLTEEISKQRQHLEAKYDALLQELKTYWQSWDQLMDRAVKGESIKEEERRQVREKMLDVLNRRNYIRNLVRDVNEVLEA